MAMTLEGPVADRARWHSAECSIGKAMEAVGTRSAMLILREAFYGTARFDDFAARVGVTDTVTAAQLKKLVAIGIFDKMPYREPGQRTRFEYHLTPMGRDLFPVVMGLWQWGDRYLQDGKPPLLLLDARGRQPVTVAPRAATGRRLAPEDITVLTPART